jgi:hypothetical protein
MYSFDRNAKYLEKYLQMNNDPVTIPTAEELEAMEHSSDVNAVSSPNSKDHPEGWSLLFLCEEGNRTDLNATVRWTVARDG